MTKICYHVLRILAQSRDWARVVEERGWWWEDQWTQGEKVIDATGDRHLAYYKTPPVETINRYTLCPQGVNFPVLFINKFIPNVSWSQRRSNYPVFFYSKIQITLSITNGARIENYVNVRRWWLGHRVSYQLFVNANVLIFQFPARKDSELLHQVSMRSILSLISLPSELRLNRFYFFGNYDSR